MKRHKYVFYRRFKGYNSFEAILYLNPMNIWSFFIYKNPKISFIQRNSFHRSVLRFQDDKRGYKNPFHVFIDTFKSELEKSKEFQESVKALQDKSGKLGESETYKKAVEAYNIAKKSADVAGNISNQTLRKAGQIIGDSVVATWESAPVKLARKGTVITANVISAATDPIRKNKIYKSVTESVKQAIHDGDSSHYAGYVDKNTRRQARKSKNKENIGLDQKTMFKKNSNTDLRIIIYKDSALKELWRRFRNNTRIFNYFDNWQRVFHHSENPVIETTKNVLASMKNVWYKLFSENDAAKVSRLLKNIDPSFQIESFLKELREYILPEILEAYVKGDFQTLKLWLSEASYQIWFITAKEYISQGLVSDGKVLDIRGVDVVSYRVLSPNDIPCLVISFRAQEIHLYKNAKTKELVAGSEDFIQEVTYTTAFTRLPEELSNNETKGWKIIDFIRMKTRDIL
ncbi:hypothetical protein T552_02483 [Pneumocystis carinii B80]|uniref:Mitochondrial import inner membrane translocase subunit TIM44 n=1 Tax=Pneumocystis carinii (strain B80) TaxID=1408658 RepID=A0A0W4ZF32_PNEC8|nr:hypothetical protein T552_02483 [Pneumocystis carinii B80]KTW26992.1 hypothetical protein T552_02483 [Pneumocystis carinii B80]